MKKTIIIFALLILLPTLACAGSLQEKYRSIIAKKNSSAVCTDANPVGTCTGFLVCQNFETTAEACDPCNEDNSEAWDKVLAGTATAGVDDTTATVLRGSQQLKMTDGDSVGTIRSNVFAGTTDIWIFFRYKISDATPSSSLTVAKALDVANAEKGSLQLQTSGRLRCYNGTAYSTNTTGTVLSDNTAYNVWWHHKAETSEGAADGVCDVYIQSGGTYTRPAAEGTGVTAGTSVEEITRIAFYVDYSETIYADQVLADNAEIGTVCP